MKKLVVLALLGLAAPVLAQTYTYPAASPTIAPAPTAYCPQLSYNLYIGLSDRYTGGQVSQLQQFLSYRGYYQPVTGYFGALTRANVAQFQRQYAVYPVTGGVGPLTRGAIARTCGGQCYIEPWLCGTGGTFSAYPPAGQAPLTVTFSAPKLSPGAYFAVDFGDGQSANTLQGSVTHTYYARGTYTAQATTDLPCLHTTPQCYTFAAQQLLGSATVTVY